MFRTDITCCYLYVITRYGYPPPAEDTLRHIDEMAALGFRSVEMEGIRDGHLNDLYERRHEIGRHVQSLGVEIPYFCIVLPGLSSPDAAERSRNLAQFERGCEIASLLRSVGVVDNAPLPPYVFPDDIPVVRHYEEDVVLSARLPAQLNWKQYWLELTATYREACDIAARFGLTYNMHPAVGVLASTADAYLYFHDAVARDNLRFNLDTSNLYLLKDNLALALHRLNGYVDYIHVSDSRGHRVEHLPLGCGTIRWDVFFETLDAIGFKGHMGIDVGGVESEIDDLDDAFVSSARWLQERWITEESP